MTNTNTKDAVGSSREVFLMEEIKRLEQALEKKSARGQEELHHTLDNLLEGIQIHDFDWRYRYVNDALVKYSHYTREELLGYTLMEKYPGIEQTELFKVMERCMLERVTEHFETEFTFPDGSTTDFELSIQPVPQGIFILSIDITQRRKAEAAIRKLNEELEQKVAERMTELQTNIQELKESEGKFQKAFYASAAGITITRISDSTYLEVNDAFVAITGFSREELIGHSSLALGIVTDMKRRDVILEEIRRTGSARNFELTVREKSGKIIEVLASVETILLKGEKFALNIIYDITARKRAEEQLEIANKELESFSYSVSHDLRAPIRAINGNANILIEEEKERLSTEGIVTLQNIVRNSSRMGVLIDDLLAFSQLGRKHLAISDVNMDTLIAGILEEMVTNEDKYRTEITVEKLPTFKGDPSLIRQVWVNLISNALKYTRNKTRTVVKIGADRRADSIVFYIRDNGAGFDMRYSHKLFGVFQRLHLDKEFDGTGIGLAIVKKIITKHEGSVWAESKLGEGSCFYVCLPASLSYL